MPTVLLRSFVRVEQNAKFKSCRVLATYNREIAWNMYSWNRRIVRPVESRCVVIVSALRYLLLMYAKYNNVVEKHRMIFQRESDVSCSFPLICYRLMHFAYGLFIWKSSCGRSRQQIIAWPIVKIYVNIAYPNVRPSTAGARGNNFR